MHNTTPYIMDTTTPYIDNNFKLHLESSPKSEDYFRIDQTGEDIKVITSSGREGKKEYNFNAKDIIKLMTMYTGGNPPSKKELEKLMRPKPCPRKTKRTRKITRTRKRRTRRNRR